MKLNFKNLSDSTKRIRLIPKDKAVASANIGVENPTLDINENGEVIFCLAPSDICVALPPLDLNLAKTFYPFDTSKQYHLYYQDSEGNVAYSEIYGKQLNDTLGYITARDL